MGKTGSITSRDHDPWANPTLILSWMLRRPVSIANTDLQNDNKVLRENGLSACRMDDIAVNSGK